MPLKLINFGPTWTRIALISAAVVWVIFSWLFIRWNLANVIASRTETQAQESAFIADWLTDFAPSDPQVHLFAATVFENTFNIDDLTRSVREYEVATSLSPNNYLMWMNLGRARSLTGETEGALEAYRKALNLAPNYANVQWGYGNALIRSGRTEDGLAMIATAAAANPEYSRPAITIALQIFDGDVEEVRRAMGDTAVINAGLVGALLLSERFEDAFQAWDRLAPESRKTDHRDLGEKLVNGLLTAKRFRMAAGAYADITDDEQPIIGAVSNGGFEMPVKPTNTSVFEWRLSPGTHPQIGLSESLKRSGRYGLLMLFNSMEAAGFISLDQTIAVEPGVDYELEIFYRSDIRSNAQLRWEILNTAESTIIAYSEPLAAAGGWIPVRIRFRTEKTDGIQIRLIRHGCNGPTCPMNGRLAFDDISLRRL